MRENIWEKNAALECFDCIRFNRKRNRLESARWNASETVIEQRFFRSKSCKKKRATVLNIGRTKDILHMALLRSIDGDGDAITSYILRLCYIICFTFNSVCIHRVCVYAHVTLSFESVSFAQPLSLLLSIILFFSSKLTFRFTIRLHASAFRYVNLVIVSRFMHLMLVFKRFWNAHLYLADALTHLYHMHFISSQCFSRFARAPSLSLTSPHIIAIKLRLSTISAASIPKPHFRSLFNSQWKKFRLFHLFRRTFILSLSISVLQCQAIHGDCFAHFI